MFPNKLPLLRLLLVSAMLSGCTVVPEKVVTEPATWAAEQQLRRQIDNWEIRGRLGVQMTHNGGSMDIVWQQAEQDYSIHLIAPLGAGSYHIQGDEDSAEVRFPDGHKQRIDDVEKIFSSALDIELPASAVKDWVRGVPASTMPIDDIQWNSRGQLHTLKQAGWNIEMNKYTGSKMLMPHQLYLSRDGDDDLDIRLVLRQWLIDN